MMAMTSAPGLAPAPAWTTTSAPRTLYFLTVSGVAETRVSAPSVSERTAIRILAPLRSGQWLEIKLLSRISRNSRGSVEDERQEKKNADGCGSPHADGGGHGP